MNLLEWHAALIILSLALQSLSGVLALAEREVQATRTAVFDWIDTQNQQQLRLAELSPAQAIPKEGSTESALSLMELMLCLSLSSVLLLGLHQVSSTMAHQWVSIQQEVSFNQKILYSVGVLRAWLKPHDGRVWHWLPEDAADALRFTDDQGHALTLSNNSYGIRVHIGGQQKQYGLMPGAYNLHVTEKYPQGLGLSFCLDDVHHQAHCLEVICAGIL